MQKKNTSKTRQNAGPNEFISNKQNDGNNIYLNAQYKHENVDFKHEDRRYSPQYNLPSAYQDEKKINYGQKYAITFRILYETIPGEDLCVIGSIPELGNWKDVKCHLVWTTGHYWVLPQPLIVQSPVFQYKYMMHDKSKSLSTADGIWEQGIDRIADLRILPEISKNSATYINSQSQDQNQYYGDIKYYEINDEWENFHLKFSVFYPIEDPNEEIYLSIDRAGDKLIKMERQQQDYPWLINKYGQNMRPFECLLKLPNNISGECGQFGQKTQLHRLINYQYIKKNRLNSTQIVIERDPKRFFEIENPKHYQGQIGDRGTNDVYAVDQNFFLNGLINKTDGGFLSGFFVSEIPNTNLVIGPYPLYEIDVEKIRQTGVTAIFNLQIPIEIQQRGVDQTSIELYYKAKKIQTVINHTIDDTNEDNLVRCLFSGVMQLNQLINDRKQRVYVHSTSSMTRAPTLIILYLCLFVLTEDWENPQKVADFIRKFHKISCPNIRAILRVIKENKHIQDKIIAEKEEERLRKLRIAEEEAERQRKLRLEALEKEKKRITLHHDDEEKRLLGLLKTLEDDEAERLRLLKLWEEQNLQFEHFADGEIDINGLTENEIEMKCDELFRMKPIPFIPQKGEHYKIQKEIERMINELDVTIPIIHVKGEVYLIGSQKQIIQYKQTNQLTVRVGGGFSRFDEYIPNNHKIIEKTLLMNMIKSKESLEWVCDALMKDKRIPQIANPYELKDRNEGQNRITITRRLAYAPDESSLRSSPGRNHMNNISPKSNRKSTSPIRTRTSLPGSRLSPNIAKIDISGKKSPSSPSKNSSGSKSPIRRNTLLSRPYNNGFDNYTGPKGGPGSPEYRYQQSKEQLLRSLSQNAASKTENLNIINEKIQKEIKAQDEARRQAKFQLQKQY